MKANEFVKKYGVEEAKEFLNAPHWSIDQLMILQSGLRCEELQRLVESHELVEKLGGLERAKLSLTTSDRRLGYTHIYLHSNNYYCFLDECVDYIIPERAIKIKLAIKAIADVEACQ